MTYILSLFLDANTSIHVFHVNRLRSFANCQQHRLNRDFLQKVTGLDGLDLKTAVWGCLKIGLKSWRSGDVCQKSEQTNL